MSTTGSKDSIKSKICSKNRIKRENTNCGNKTLVYKDKNKYFGLITR